MTERGIDRTIFCYAEGKGEHWEAYCLTFDLTVHGRSFGEVRQKIGEQIGLFIEGVNNLPESERARLLRRRAPVREWLRPLWKVMLAGLGRRDPKERHEFSFPLGNLSAA